MQTHSEVTKGNFYNKIQSSLNVLDITDGQIDGFSDYQFQKMLNDAANKIIRQEKLMF